MFVIKWYRHFWATNIQHNNTWRSGQLAFSALETKEEMHLLASQSARKDVETARSLLVACERTDTAAFEDVLFLEMTAFLSLPPFPCLYDSLYSTRICSDKGWIHTAWRYLVVNCHNLGNIFQDKNTFKGSHSYISTQRLIVFKFTTQKSSLSLFLFSQYNPTEQWGQSYYALCPWLY